MISEDYVFPSLKIELPYRLKIGNKYYPLTSNRLYRANRGLLIKIKEEVRKLTIKQLNAYVEACIKEIRNLYVKEIEIKLICKDNKKRDLLNIVYCEKFITDTLVEYEFMKDDTNINKCVLSKETDKELKDNKIILTYIINNKY